MADPNKAVVLSYASQDAEAAKRICDALRAADIEVWFDQSELRGGRCLGPVDPQADQDLRLISRRHLSEYARSRRGVFPARVEARVDRSHLIAADQAFLLPVVIDDTRDNDERVPERFREVQWTRLPGGETPLAFVERVSRAALARDLSRPNSAYSTRALARVSHFLHAHSFRRRTGVVYGAIATAVLLVALGYFAFERIELSKPIDLVRPPSLYCRLRTRAARRVSNISPMGSRRT